MRRLLEGYHAVRDVSFRVTKIEVEPDAERKVRATVSYAITGIGESRGPRQDQGVWRTEWTDDHGTWRLMDLEGLDFSRLESPAHFFHDVSAHALGKNASFIRQLNKGTGYWAERLDVASQIDFYGLNGIAVGDYDGDGWEDVYVCEPGGLPNRLFRNRGDGTFEDVTEQTGLAVLDSTSAAVWADYDNDGDQDLFVITPGEILLFENDGHGRFKRSQKARFEIPVEERGVLMMAVVADYDRDGFLDLFVCQYSPAAGSSMAKYLSQPTPYYDANNGPPNQLFHNNGNGTFTNVTHKAGLANNNRWSFAAAWGDYNQDGYPDLYVANDFGRNNLYRNNKDGTFTDVASQAGVEDIGAGMSVAWGDYDNDGRPDLYISNIWSAAGQRITRYQGFQQSASPEIRKLLQRFAEGNSLFHNEGNSRFADTTAQATVANGGWAWSSDFIDFNNDGWEDLFVVNGHITNDQKRDLESFHWTNVVANSPLGPVRSKKYEEGWRQFQNLMSESGLSIHGGERKRLYFNSGKGNFVDISGLSGLDFSDDGRSFSIVDFDNDGDLDLIVKNRTAPQVRVLRNDTINSHHSVAFELVGHRSNRDAVGAKVTLQAGAWSRMKEVRSGSGFLSQHTRRIYFGLGADNVISRVRISWPSGAGQELAKVPVDSIIRVEEGAAGFSARPFRPKNSTMSPGPAEVAQPLWEGDRENGGTWLLEPMRMPKLELLDAEGKRHSLTEHFRGAPFLVQLWGEGCEPCQEEWNEWKAFRKELNSQQIVWVSVDNASGANRIKARSGPEVRFYRATPETIRLLNTIVRNLFARRRDIGIPLTLLLDEQGYIAKVYRGSTRWEWIREDLRLLPRTQRQRITLALPFPGQYYGALGSRLEAYFLIASDCLKNGLAEEALAFFQECLKIDPRLGSVVNNIGTIYAGKGRLDTALETYERAGRLDPQSAEVQFNIGTTLAMKGQFQEAVTRLKEAARMDPASAEIWTNLGNAYLDWGQPAAARQSLERALQLDPKSALVHNSLGTLYGRQGSLDRALEELQSAIRLQPDYESAYLNLGILYLKKQERRKAIEMFRKVRELNPRNADARRMLEQLQ